jgi:hypothetical protein
MPALRILTYALDRTGPTVIIGAHRSGTSIICEALRRNGLYLGNRLDHHAESQAIVEINEKLLRTAKASWSQPERFLEQLASNSAFLDDAIHWLHSELAGLRFVRRYLGTDVFKRFFRKPLVWGFKDPRNTVTLPVWLGLFPDAKVIHIYRHGIDVAESLHLRERERDIDHRYYASQCATLEGCFTTWRVYVLAALELQKRLPHKNFFAVRYEDFVGKTDEVLNDLLGFIGIRSAAFPWRPIVKAERAYAYLRNSQSLEIYDKLSCDPLLRALGYGEIGR